MLHVVGDLTDLHGGSGVTNRRISAHKIHIKNQNSKIIFGKKNIAKKSTFAHEIRLLARTVYTHHSYFDSSVTVALIKM